MDRCRIDAAAMTRTVVEDPASAVFRPSGVLLHLAALTPVAIGVMGLVFWATDDGSGDPLGMKFILGFACFFLLMGAGFFWFAARHTRPCLWIGPAGLFDSRIMTGALAWSDIAAARTCHFRIGKYPVEAIALSTPRMEEIARAGPRLRAFNHGFTGMPDLPVQISGMAGGAEPILAAFQRHHPIDRAASRPA